jgi:ribokinase
MKKFDVVVVGTATRDVYLISKDFAAYKAEDESLIALPANTKIDMPDIASDIGGGAPNAAVTFSRAGLKTACMAKVGADASGREVELTLKKDKIIPLLNKDKCHQTGLTLVLKGPNGEDTMFIHRGAGYEYRTKDFDMGRIQTKWLYITSLGGDLLVLNRLVKWAVSRGSRIAINPGPLELAKPKRLISILKKVDAVIVNRREAEGLLGDDDTTEMLRTARRLGLHTVVITDSQSGATILDGNYLYRSGIYKKVAVVDRSGAGYAYGSGLVAAIVKGKSMQQAMSFAAANATSVVTYLGARVGILSDTDVDIMKVNISVFHEKGDK